MTNITTSSPSSYLPKTVLSKCCEASGSSLTGTDSHDLVLTTISLLTFKNPLHVCCVVASYVPVYVPQDTQTTSFSLWSRGFSLSPAGGVWNVLLLFLTDRRCPQSSYPCQGRSRDLLSRDRNHPHTD